MTRRGFIGTLLASFGLAPSLVSEAVAKMPPELPDEDLAPKLPAVKPWPTVRLTYDGIELRVADVMVEQSAVEIDASFWDDDFPPMAGPTVAQVSVYAAANQLNELLRRIDGRTYPFALDVKCDGAAICRIDSKAMIANADLSSDLGSDLMRASVEFRMIGPVALS